MHHPIKKSRINITIKPINCLFKTKSASLPEGNEALLTKFAYHTDWLSLRIHKLKTKETIYVKTKTAI